MNKKLNVVTSYATYENCNLEVNKYQANGSMHIGIWNCTEGPIATLTVCLPDARKPKEGEAYIDTNNCPWAEDFIEEYGLGEDTGLMGFSGFCMYPLYRFNMDKVNEYI